MQSVMTSETGQRESGDTGAMQQWISTVKRGQLGLGRDWYFLVYCWARYSSAGVETQNSYSVFVYGQVFFQQCNTEEVLDL